MWTCPKCKQRFVNKSQWHSCGKNTLGGFLKGKTPYAVELFHYFVDQYKKIGKFDLHPAKTRLAFVAKIRFAGVTKIGKDYIQCGLLFDRLYNDECFYQIEKIPPARPGGREYFANRFRLYKKSDLTPKLKKYMRMAYDIGLRKHIKKKASENSK
jgi:hypothetical protein